MRSSGLVSGYPGVLGDKGDGEAVYGGFKGNLPVFWLISWVIAFESRVDQRHNTLKFAHPVAGTPSKSSNFAAPSPSYLLMLHFNSPISHAFPWFPRKILS